MSSETIAVVERYLKGLREKDLSEVPFAPDVVFESPLSPQVTGAAPVQELLAGLFPAIRDVRIHRHIAEGEYVATLFDLDTVFGVIPVFDCFRIVDGQVRQIRPFYDPRPILDGMARQAAAT